MDSFANLNNALPLGDVSHIRTIAVALVALLAIEFGVLLAIRIAADRGQRRLLFGLLGVPLGPLAPLLAYLLPATRPVTAPRFSRFHPAAALVAIAIGTLTMIAAVSIGFVAFDERGEPLQSYIVAGALVGGLLAGLCAAMVARRVAFFETLALDMVLFCGVAVLGQRVEVAFTYGTTPVYFIVVAIAALLILEVARVLGGSVGFMIAGDGKLSLRFGYEAWVGRRYLMAKRRSSFISVITVISIGGVAVGVWAMLVVLSVMSGFMADIRGKILGANAHLIVLKYGIDFTEYDDVMTKIRQVPSVTGASPFVLNEVMLSSDVNLSGAIIKGIVPSSAPQVSDLAKNMVQGTLESLEHPDQIERPQPLPGTRPAAGSNGSAPAPVIPRAPPAVGSRPGDDDPWKSRERDDVILPGIIIGQELARSLKVFVGDPINVVSPVGELGPTGPVPKAKAFRVSGIFYSGMYEYDAKFVYIKLEEAQSFFTTKGAVTGVEVKVDDIENTTPISRAVLQQVGGYPYRTKDWKEMNRNLFSALKLEKIAMFIILIFIVLVASFNILSTLIMVVLEKGKEIAILKSMGATDSSVMKIFVVYGLVIGCLGTALGVVLGFLSCIAIRKFGVGLDPEVYYIAQLPVRMNPFEFTLVSLSALVVSYLATIYPSLQAAQLNPVDGLRYD